MLEGMGAAHTCSHLALSASAITGTLLRLMAYKQPSIRWRPLKTRLKLPLPASPLDLNSVLQVTAVGWGGSGCRAGRRLQGAVPGQR